YIHTNTMYRYSMSLVLMATITLMLATSVSAHNTANCTNVNGDNFFNRCFKNNEGVLPLLANFIMQFVNPRTVAITVSSMLFVLPAMMLLGTTPSSYPTIKNKFLSLRVDIVHMLHRAAYPLVLGVGLYAIFRQRRPCICDGAHIGSYYGMPSGDAMAGGILGALLIDKAPFYPMFSRITGVLLMVCVCFERTILGYHSVGQVVTGTTIGFFLHFYSTRVPQWVLFIDIIAQWILATVALQVDPALVYQQNDPNNLFVWFIWGLSFQVLVLFYLAMIGRSPFGGYGLLKKSYHSLANPDLNIQSEDDDQMLSFSIKPTSDFQESKERFNKRIKEDSGVIFSVVAYIVFFAVNFLSFCFQNWNWLVKVSTSANGGTPM
ncbi:hypothetical protein SAMD00019534_030150, partial [Acytostelium subglobosum LB1]|uniref:hypothetical protein n=1 Tax=Acytostelium subglobosum LB1 TaxID=1410327 RepID=UPI000644B2EA